MLSGPPGFSSLFMTHQNRVDHTFWPHLQKNKQKMKTGWTTHSWNNAIWLALRPCHMTMTHKINKLEKPGGPQGNFHALFGRSSTFYGHFRADAVTSECSTRISASPCCVFMLHFKMTKSTYCNLVKTSTTAKQFTPLKILKVKQLRLNKPVKYFLF